MRARRQSAGLLLFDQERLCAIIGRKGESMELRIYLEGETYPFVCCPLAYLAIELANPHARTLLRLEVRYANGEVRADIDCSGLPSGWERIRFTADWTAEALTDSGIYRYMPREKKWRERNSLSR